MSFARRFLQFSTAVRRFLSCNPSRNRNTRSFCQHTWTSRKNQRVCIVYKLSNTVAPLMPTPNPRRTMHVHWNPLTHQAATGGLPHVNVETCALGLSRRWVTNKWKKEPQPRGYNRNQSGWLREFPKNQWSFHEYRNNSMHIETAFSPIPLCPLTYSTLKRRKIGAELRSLNENLALVRNRVPPGAGVSSKGHCELFKSCSCFRWIL